MLRAFPGADSGVRLSRQSGARPLRNSLRRKGDCDDNAVGKSFFDTFKIELTGDASAERSRIAFHG